MNDKKFESLLIGIFDVLSEEDPMENLDAFSILQGSNAISFKEASLLTDDRGVVLTLSNGDEFLLTIKSR